jgi:uncharacterized protein
MRELLILLIFLIGCSADYLVVENVKIKVEIADSLEEKMQGLMNRESLGENEGMLFIFDDEDYYSFWMKNTLIPLEIIHIDENMEIVDIIHAVPCEEEPCESYKAIEMSKYVLEVNEGFSGKNNIRIGSKVSF